MYIMTLQVKFSDSTLLGGGRRGVFSHCSDITSVPFAIQQEFPPSESYCSYSISFKAMNKKCHWGHVMCDDTSS